MNGARVCETCISKAPKAGGNAVAPVGLIAIEIDLGSKVLGDAPEQVFLAPNMIVERHWGDAEVVGEAPHRYRFEPFTVHQAESPFQYQFAG